MRHAPRLTPEKTQQRVTLFTQPTEPLPPATRIFTWNQSHITSQGLACLRNRAGSPKNTSVANAVIGPTPGCAGHQQPRFQLVRQACIFYSLVQFLDLRFTNFSYIACSSLRR